MKKATKIIITIISIVVFLFLFAILISIRQANGFRTPGMLGLILFAALIGAIRAVWHNPDNDTKLY